MVYSNKTAAEAILHGMRDLERAYENADHYRNGPTPQHIEDDLDRALDQVAEGLRYVLEFEPSR